jgi:hypothetical protein
MNIYQFSRINESASASCLAGNGRRVVNSRILQGSKIGPLKGQQGEFGSDCSCRPRPTFIITPFFPLSPQPRRRTDLYPFSLPIGVPSCFPSPQPISLYLALGGKGGEIKPTYLIRAVFDLQTNTITGSPVVQL